MQSTRLTRRKFVTTSASAMILASAAGSTALAQTASPFKGRMSWETFRLTAQCQWFINAIAAMRANTNENDPRSLQYWVKVHQTSCKHGVPYFLAWHRGCLFHFERQLQAISGHDDLMVPYWDYYKNPAIPAEFTNAVAGNPLYETRLNTNVSQALTLAPFSDFFKNFATGTAADAFERSLESKPHDPIHDIIGSVMSTMGATRDPLFWLHHANVDRLWTAWAAAGNGRQTPAKDSAYWAVNFAYGPALSMNAIYTYDIRSDLRYYYEDETLPRTIIAPNKQGSASPATAFHTTKPSRFRYLRVGDPASIAPASRLAALRDELKRLPVRPPVKRFIESAKRQIDATRLALGGVKDVVLDQVSVSARLRLTSEARATLQSVIARISDSPYGKIVQDPFAGSAAKFTSVQVVLDKIQISELGKIGGYYYNIFLNLDALPDRLTTEERHLIGTFGPFKLAGALNHARMSGMSDGSELVRIVFPATRLLANLSTNELIDPTISFVRVSGDHTPDGPVIQIGEARIDVTMDEFN